MSYVSIRKWDGKEEYKQVLAHAAGHEIEDNLMEQLNKISQDAIKMIDGREVKINFFECHDIVAICNLVCNNNVSLMGNKFCPWCTCHKKSIHMVIDEIKIEEGDTICSVSEFYAMSTNLLLVSYAHLLQVLKFMFIYCHYFLNITLF